MAEEDDRRPRLLRGDEAVEGPEVANDLVPSAFVGEMAEIGGRSFGPVTAMVVGVSRVARGIERVGERGVAGAVLGEAMGDLQNRARRTFRQPTAPQKRLAIVGAKVEFAPRHSPSHLKGQRILFRNPPSASSAQTRPGSVRSRQIYSSQNRLGSVRSRVPWRGISSSPAAWSPRLARDSVQRLWARFSRRAAIPSACASSIPILMSIRAR